MATTNYFTVNGELTGEIGPNGTMIYHTDALGSVTATSDQNGNKLNDYRYKPYGALLSKSGTDPDPEFQWVGSFGYRRTSLPHSGSYMRNRHYGMEEGRWTTVDPLWPTEQPYGYVLGRSQTFVDPFGLSTGCGPACLAVSSRRCDFQKLPLYCCYELRTALGPICIFRCGVGCVGPTMSALEAVHDGSAYLRKIFGICDPGKPESKIDANRWCPYESGQHITFNYCCGPQRKTKVVFSITSCSCIPPSSGSSCGGPLVDNYKWFKAHLSRPSLTGLYEC